VKLAYLFIVFVYLLLFGHCQKSHKSVGFFNDASSQRGTPRFCVTVKTEQSDDVVY